MTKSSSYNNSTTLKNTARHIMEDVAQLVE